MIDPSKLKRDPNRPYAFKSRLKTLCMRFMDAVGGMLFGHTNPGVEWKAAKKIAVLRLDHLGDVLLALPALKALEQALPQAQVDLFIGPWAKEALEIAGLRATPQVFSASWFARKGVPKPGSVDELKKILAEGKYDAAIELRGDFRHILAMYRAGIPNRVGLARTGFGFLLTHSLVFRAGLHETRRNLDLLEQAGVPLIQKTEFPELHPRSGDNQAAKTVFQKLGITQPIVVIHAVCPNPAKRWPSENWKKLIGGLPGNLDVVLIGTEAEREGMEEIQKGCNRKVFIAAGLLNLPVLAAFLKESALFVGVDSGPAHVAAAVGTSVLSLYSGTNVAAQWAPRGTKVEVLQKTPSCSPCELTVCPIGNECMRLITVEEALEKAKALLASSV